jgi:hypothetical protein
MKKLITKFESTMMAIAFAEAGEFETAREMLREDKPRKNDRPRTYRRPSQRPTLRAD